MSRKTRYSPEVRERAIRLVLEHQAEYESQWAAMHSTAGVHQSLELDGRIRTGVAQLGRREGRPGIRRLKTA